MPVIPSAVKANINVALCRSTLFINLSISCFENGHRNLILAGSQEESLVVWLMPGVCCASLSLILSNVPLVCKDVMSHCHRCERVFFHLGDNQVEACQDAEESRDFGG